METLEMFNAFTGESFSTEAETVESLIREDFLKLMLSTEFDKLALKLVLLRGKIKTPPKDIMGLIMGVASSSTELSYLRTAPGTSLLMTVERVRQILYSKGFNVRSPKELAIILKRDLTIAQYEQMVNNHFNKRVEQYKSRIPVYNKLMLTEQGSEIMNRDYYFYDNATITKTVTSSLGDINIVYKREYFIPLLLEMLSTYIHENRQAYTQEELDEFESNLNSVMRFDYKLYEGVKKTVEAELRSGVPYVPMDTFDSTIFNRIVNYIKLANKPEELRSEYYSLKKQIITVLYRALKHNNRRDLNKITFILDVFQTQHRGVDLL